MKKAIKVFLTICWCVFFIKGITQNAHKYDFISWLIIICVFIFPFVFSVLSQRKRKNKPANEQQQVVIAEKEDAYITDSNITSRTDGNTISDEEVPYLIQVGYENALRRQQESTNPKHRRTPYEEELSFRFFEKYHDKAFAIANKSCILYNEAKKTKDLSKRIKLLNEAIVVFEKAKNFCYSKGKGGTIYFQDMWEYMSNEQNPCYSYSDVIQQALKDAITERDVIVPAILNVISEYEGILQKDIYCKLPDVEKSVIQRIIRRLEEENKIERIKKSGSYELQIVEQ